VLRCPGLTGEDVMPGGDVTQAGGKEDEGRYMTLYIAISSTILNLAFTLLSIYNQS